MLARKTLLVVLAIVMLASVPVFAQNDTKTYTGQGMAFEYPADWYIHEQLSEVWLSNEPVDTAKLYGPSGTIVVTVGEAYQETIDLLGENLPLYLLGGNVGKTMTTFFWSDWNENRYATEQPESDSTLIAFESQDGLLMVHYTLTYFNAVELVVFVKSSFYVVAMTPAGEIDEWMTALHALTRSLRSAE